MQRYVIQRLAFGPIVALLVATLVVLLVRLLPGDIVDVLTREAPQYGDATALRQERGLDKPFLEQYLGFLAGLPQGDFGDSLYFRHPVVEDVRRALPVTLELALDRPAINQLAGGGSATIRTGPIARGWPAWTRSDEQIAPEAAQDIAKAKQLLTAAGYPTGFETEWIFGPYAGTVDTSTKIAQVAQEQLKAAGIEMKITMMENLAWQRRLQQQDFSLSTWVIRAYPDPDDYLYPFWVPGAAKNFGKVDDPALTDLVLKQRQAAAPQERKTILQEIDRRWTQDFNYGVWTIEYPFAHIYNNRQRNYSSGNPLDYAGLAEVFVKQ